MIDICTSGLGWLHVTNDELILPTIELLVTFIVCPAISFKHLNIHWVTDKLSIYERNSSAGSHRLGEQSRMLATDLLSVLCEPPMGVLRSQSRRVLCEFTEAGAG